MDLPKNYISYSQIRLYQSCPKKYYYSYIEKIDTPLNDKVFLGVVFHSAVEYYLKKQIEGKKPEKDELREYFIEQFSKGQQKNEIKWTDGETETRKRGLAFVHHFHNYVGPEIDPLMVEKELVAELPDLDVKLKGIVDLVETDFSITDFKTTTAKWSKARIQGSYLQMQIYRYLFEKSFGDVISQLRFRVVYAKNSTSVKDQKVSVNAKDLDSGKMMDIIKYVVDNIRAEVFYKNDNYSCGFCEYKDICKKKI